MNLKLAFNVLIIFGFTLSLACAPENATTTGEELDDNPLATSSDQTQEFNFTSGATETVNVSDGEAIEPLEVDPLRFAVEVIEFIPGEYSGHGADYMPDNVLGPPHGRGDAIQQSGEDQVLSLGHGGSITLRLGVAIADGEGPDFTVFENVIYFGGSVASTATEAAFVEVSETGVDWVRFPNDYNPLGSETYAYANPASFRGFAGIHPVYADPELGIDPLDPTVSGGDCFDLADVGLQRASYVRLIDTGHADLAPGSETTDDDGDRIDDGGNHFTPSLDREGFDLDAIGVINADATTE
jgi:hypothetical protein